MDEDLVPTAQQLRIGRSNFRLLSDIKSKESTLQLVYDVLDILHIRPRVHGQPFTEPPFKEEILAFIHFLGHSAVIRTLTDVNINKLYQPWRDFAAIINKCLTGKSSGYNSLRLSQAQILWGLYHKRNVDYAYLMWEDFVYQVEHKNQKKSNEMYYPRFTKAIIHHFMSKDPLIPRRNKFGALLPIELTNDEIKNSKAYKEYYAIATGETAPKPKASVRRTKSSSNTSITPPTAATSPRLTTSAKGKQTAKASKAKSLSALFEPSGSGVDKGDDDDDADQEVVRDVSKDDDEEGGGDEQESNEETREEESFDHIPQTPKNTKDKGNGEEDLGLNIGEEERHIEEEEEDELYRDVNINQGRGLQASLEVKDSHVTLTPVNPDGRLHDEAQRENDKFLRIVDENIKTIIKEQVKEQVKVQVSKILTRIEHAVNDQLEAEVLTRLSHSSRTSYGVGVDLSEMELKKILIEKIEGNKSIQCSDEQRNLYKAVVDAYESDKLTLDTYEETFTLKRRRDDDADKDEEPSAGPDRGSKRRREGKKPESASAPTETATRIVDKSSQGSRSRQASTSEYALVRSLCRLPLRWKIPPIRSLMQTLSAVYGSIQPWISELAKQADSRSSFNELMDTPMDFYNFLMNRLRVDTLTPELLAGLTYDLMKGSCKILIELEYHLEEVQKTITDQLDWINPEGQQYPHNLLQPLPLIPNN
uniref:Monodehydroascorbate reductase n=1 Tax=Tanacetum cinerariifolium TaxID=118510 RepID=A0A699HV60_TANCI|nr:hypothetical protein [Tanacetum cinerariifolium]